MILYPGSEILILPCLSYPGCHERTVHWFVFELAHSHGRQVTSMFNQSDFIIRHCISAYSGTSGSLFKIKSQW